MVQSRYRGWTPTATGAAAEDAVAATLAPVAHRLHRWGDGGANPYAGMLAWADTVVVTGDSVSMLSEALATPAPVFIADPGGLGPRHRRLHDSLLAAGQARLLAEAPAPFARDALDDAHPHAQRRFGAAVRDRKGGGDDAFAAQCPEAVPGELVAAADRVGARPDLLLDNALDAIEGNHANGGRWWRCRAYRCAYRRGRGRIPD